MELTKEDLREALRDLKEDLNQRFIDVNTRASEGFDGVHSRLDKLNGQTAQNKNDITVLQTRCEIREKLVPLRGPEGPAGPEGSPAGLIGTISAGGWKTIGAAVLVLAGSFSALINIVVKLVEALLPHLKP